jgi:general secretion pathway protein L
VPCYLFLADSDRFTAEAKLRWVAVADRGGAVSTGVSTGAAALGELARHNSVIAVVPTPRMAFIDAQLPAVSAAKREQLLNFAIEDKLTIDPATVHAVVLGPSASGANRFIVAAIDKAWLTAVLAGLADVGIRPGMAVPETALNDIPSTQWLVHLSATAQYAVRADGLAYTLDATPEGDGGTLDEPPFALTLALNEAIGASDSRALPDTIVVRAETNTSIDTQRWQAAIGHNIAVRLVPLSNEADQTTLRKFANMSLSTLASANLLTGELTPVARNRAWYAANPAFTPAAVLAGVILLVQFVFISVDAWRLASARQTQLTEMRTLFQSSFPEAATIVDAPLQMSRNLAQLKAERGIGGDSAVLQIAKAAALTRDSSAQIREVRLRNSNLEVALEALSETSFTNLQREVGTLAESRISRTQDRTTISILGDGVKP